LTTAHEVDMFKEQIDYVMRAYSFNTFIVDVKYFITDLKHNQLVLFVKFFYLFERILLIILKNLTNGSCHISLFKSQVVAHNFLNQGLMFFMRLVRFWDRYTAIEKQLRLMTDGTDVLTYDVKLN